MFCTSVAAWIRASFWDSRFVNILPKRSAKVSRKLVPNVLTVFLNFTFWGLVFFLKPSKSWFQTTSRQNDVSWVHGTFAEIQYCPHEGEGGGGRKHQFETMHERKKRFAQLWPIYLASGMQFERILVIIISTIKLWNFSCMWRAFQKKGSNPTFWHLKRAVLNCDHMGRFC